MLELHQESSRRIRMSVAEDVFEESRTRLRAAKNVADDLKRGIDDLERGVRAMRT